MAGMVERLKHWKSTAAGLAIGGVVLAVFKSFHCELPSDWLTWAVTALPVILGSFSK